jgi:hypothetical protein
MNNKKSVFGVIVLGMLASYLVIAQNPPASTAQKPSMNFFITSVGAGNGGDLGGLAGADAHCQKLATAVGAGNKTWHAYLSTQASGNQPAVNARDRIGQGPWYNAKGVPIAKDLAELHGDTLDLARYGNHLTKQNALTEAGAVNNGAGDTPNTHDILTGSQMDGRAYTDSADHTCHNWTSSSDAPGNSAQIGHSDRQAIPTTSTSWNSAHATRGCSQQGIASTGGAAAFYCFAIN